jgi:iron(III) transport system substrate-binding protein
MSMDFRRPGFAGRVAVLAALLLAGHQPALAADSEVNIYTTREPGLIQPLLDTFTQETGIRTNTVFVESGIAERLEAEGANSPADVVMVVDYGMLIDMVERGLTQAVDSEVLNEAIPENLRGPEGHWYAMSMRARVIYVSKDRVDDESMTYEDLADPKWKGRVCIRSGQHPYNNALFSAMIAKDGAKKTEEFLVSLRSNLGRTAGGGDRDVARDILADICDVGLGNSYYVGLMRSGTGGPEQQEWGNAIRVIIPTFADHAGTHVNVSGVVVPKHAPHKDNALKLLEFLVSPEAQAIYAKGNFEYPIAAGAVPDPIIEALGDLTIDGLPLVEIYKHRKAASELVDKVGFDQAM